MNLKTLRKQLGITQEKAAALAGVALATWNRWEKGKHIPVGGNAKRLEAMQKAADAPPCEWSDAEFQLRPGSTLDHITSCARCSLAWITGGVYNAR